ncbi:MAG: 16S rRNA (cytosine(1402)-N(4))-methyltransferase RsmH [Myxococcota bacterium]
MTRPFLHDSVLVRESVEWLGVRPGVRMVDATVGGGGHAEAILEASAPDGRLLGMDLDEEALAHAKSRLHRFGDRVTLLRGSFRELEASLSATGFGPVDGVLFDFGVSSHQLGAPERGFGFSTAPQETPLDMRMDPEGGATAADLLARASEAELVEWLRSYGELPGATRLARAIVRERRRTPLENVGDLLRIVRESGIGRGRRHHPATLVFQALRIAVNDELAALEEGLLASIGALQAGGRLVTLAYHSLEDRRVKQRLRAEARGCVCPPELPECRCGRLPRLRILTPKVVRPTVEEVRRNPRARSARLRAAERLTDAA